MRLWGCANREASRIDSGPHLRPQKRHRDGRAVAGARRQWCDCGRHAVVAQIVKVDAAGAILLRHLREITLGIVGGHLEAEVARERFRVRPGRFTFLRLAERSHDVHTLAARRFAEAHEANGFEPVANFTRALDDRREINIRRGIEIEDEAAGHLGIPGLAIPGMQLQSGQLRNFRETLDSIDLKVRLLAARHLRQREHARRARHRMALKKMLSANSVRRANNRARPAFQMRDHPGSNYLVVLRQLQLGDRLSITGVRPQRFIRLRDLDAHHDRIASLPPRTRLRFGAHRFAASALLTVDATANRRSAWRRIRSHPSSGHRSR